MKTSELLNRASDYFKKNGIESGRLDAEILYCFASGINKEKLLASFDEEASEETTDFYRKLVLKRGSRIPVSYITGKKDFYDVTLFLNSKCLIPRPETEQIIDIIFSDYSFRNQLSDYKILDLCSGPGTIIIPLMKKSRNTSGIAADIDESALSALYTNAENYSLLNRLKILNADVLSDEFYKTNNFSEIDILVCNPPYIKKNEYENLQPEIKFEPKHALIAEDNGCEFYKKIIPHIRKIIKSGGNAYFEISETILNDIESFLSNNFEYKIFFNFNNKPNVLK
nr:peptide chain release factor N(5)-glutamine methyltransferase [Candidatus Dependentiae bacterium]